MIHDKKRVNALQAAAKAGIEALKELRNKTTVRSKRPFLPDRTLPVSDPDVSRPRLIRDACFLEASRHEIALRRGRHNRLGFADPIAFVRGLGRWKNAQPLVCIFCTDQVSTLRSSITGRKLQSCERISPIAACRSSSGRTLARSFDISASTLVGIFRPRIDANSSPSFRKAGSTPTGRRIQAPWSCRS